MQHIIQCSKMKKNTPKATLIAPRLNIMMIPLIHSVFQYDNFFYRKINIKSQDNFFQQTFMVTLMTWPSCLLRSLSSMFQPGIKVVGLIGDSGINLVVCPLLTTVYVPGKVII